MRNPNNTATGDQALLNRVASGEQEAFEALYQGYHRRLYQYLLTLVRDEATAEELVVEVMLAIWKGAGTFRGGSQVSTWIFGIARNKALDAIRQGTRRQRQVPLEEAAELIDTQNDPGSEANRKSLVTLSQRALAALSDEHREVMQLALYEELSCQEIAAIAGCPVNTVKTRLYYARQHLKKILQGMGVRESEI